MTSEQLDDLERLARTSGRKLHPDKALALIARVRALEADRDRLAAEVERLKAAARDFLNNHLLDCGAHYCRYCPARSPEWRHEPYCAYIRSQSAYTALWAAVREESSDA